MFVSVDSPEDDLVERAEPVALVPAVPSSGALVIVASPSDPLTFDDRAVEAGAPGRISEAGHLIPETIRTIAVVGFSSLFRLLLRFYSIKLICSTQRLIPVYVHINKSSTVECKYFS